MQLRAKNRLIFYKFSIIIPTSQQKGDIMNNKTHLEQDFPVMFSDKMPDGYKNDVQYWGNIPREDLYKTLPDGTPAMQMMDIDFGDVCSLKCPHCFRRDDRNDILKNPLSNEQIIDYIRQGKDLGVKSVKILGRGEPFQNPDFLGFLRTMTEMDIGVGIFTKGTVLGDDNMAAHYNEKYGIKSARDLTYAIKELKTAVYLNFMSFNDDISSKMVGNVPEYVERRNIALRNLVDAKFNEFVSGVPTRLALVCAPYTPETVDELFDIYKFAHERNMYCIACPTTLSGKGIDTYAGQQKSGHYTDFIDKAEHVYSKIYTYAIEKGIMSIDDFMHDGPHVYPGAYPCNQTMAGFYLQLSGQVNWCPGRVESDTLCTRDIRNYENLKECWVKSPACRRAKQYTNETGPFNCGCVARDKRSLPNDFYEKIKNMTLENLNDLSLSNIS